jgi:hypothetical protein
VQQGITLVDAVVRIGFLDKVPAIHLHQWMFPELSRFPVDKLTCQKWWGFLFDI